MKKALSLILMIFFIQSNAQDMKEAYFASGCFWCVESIYESLVGVDKSNQAILVVILKILLIIQF